MDLLSLLLAFFSGLFVCNSIPHLVSGLRGDAFPSPFASPPGKGNSSPVVNVLWGTFNLIVGFYLKLLAPFGFSVTLPTIFFFIGFILIGVFLAIHFGKARHPAA